MIASGKRMVRLMALALALAIAGGSGLARAQAVQAERPSPQDRIVAQALFDDGRELMTQKRYHEACAKFEESNRLDPAMGTQYNLADCYDFIGRYTRAWILFVDVAAAARAGGERDREAAARSRAAKLEPRLTKLRVVVDDPVPGLTVHLGERELPAAQWGTALPIEGGDYTLRAAAPGYRDWRRVVRVEGQGVTEEANVPELEPAAATAPGAASRGIDAADVRLAAAIAMGSLAVIGIGVGTGAGIVAIRKKGEADDHCPAPNQCYQEGLDLRDQARGAATVSTVSFAMAGSALVGAALLWLTSGDGSDEPPTAPSDAAPSVSPSAHWQLTPWLTWTAVSPAGDGSAAPAGAGMTAAIRF
jgi:hypothetical protein